MNTKGTWDPALIISTRLVNLSWCFLAATRPTISKSLDVSVFYFFFFFSLQNYLAGWEFWNIQTCPLQDHPWPDHIVSCKPDRHQQMLPQQTQVSVWRVNSQTQDSGKVQFSCVDLDWYHLRWAGQDESVVNVNQVASIIQQDVTIVTIFHLESYFMRLNSFDLLEGFGRWKYLNQVWDDTISSTALHKVPLGSQVLLLLQVWQAPQLWLHGAWLFTSELFWPNSRKK